MTPLEQYMSIYEYMRAKCVARDWHAVRDAAVDLEILEARHPYLEKS